VQIADPGRIFTLATRMTSDPLSSAPVTYAGETMHVKQSAALSFFACPSLLVVTFNGYDKRPVVFEGKPDAVAGAFTDTMSAGMSSSVCQ